MSGAQCLDSCVRCRDKLAGVKVINLWRNHRAGVGERPFSGVPGFFFLDLDMPYQSRLELRFSFVGLDLVAC